MSREENNKSTKAYLDVTKSVIISSPAGSGKTEKLARRYISLLLSGSEIDKILAITFTEKAAAEMQDGVLSVLERENPDLFVKILEKMPLMRVSPSVVNASSGASEHMLITRMNLAQAIEALKAENIWVVGLDQDGQTIGDKTQRHLTGTTALVVGSEGEGLRQLTRAKCDIIQKLPMQGQVESLNAAVAGSVALYLAYLARNKS